MQYDENAEKYGYEGEMTPLKCDELNAYKGDVYIPVYGTIADAQVYLKEKPTQLLRKRTKRTQNSRRNLRTCRPCHECHRANSAEFLAECIYNVFQHGVVPYDKNLVNYPKETKELLNLCKKVCERIAKEVA